MIETAGPPLDLSQLRPCDGCGRGLLRRDGQPPSLIAYRFTVDRMVYDIRAARGVAGLATMMGGEAAPGALAVAAALAPDTRLFKCATRQEVLLCSWCFMEKTASELLAIASFRAAAAEKRAGSPEGQASRDTGASEDEYSEFGDPGA